MLGNAVREGIGVEAGCYREGLEWIGVSGSVLSIGVGKRDEM